jgi:hypothetical protein
MWYLSVATFSHLTQEQRNLGFTALDEAWQDFAAPFGPSTERFGSAVPVTPVGTHTDRAALEVA